MHNCVLVFICWLRLAPKNCDFQRVSDHLLIYIHEPSHAGNGSVLKPTKIPKPWTIWSIWLGRGRFRSLVPLPFLVAWWLMGFHTKQFQAFSTLGTNNDFPMNGERDLHRWIKRLFGFRLRPYSIQVPLQDPWFDKYVVSFDFMIMFQMFDFWTPAFLIFIPSKNGNVTNFVQPWTSVQNVNIFFSLGISNLSISQRWHQPRYSMFLGLKCCTPRLMARNRSLLQSGSCSHMRSWILWLTTWVSLVVWCLEYRFWFAIEVLEPRSKTKTVGVASCFRWKQRCAPARSYSFDTSWGRRRDVHRWWSVCLEHCKCFWWDWNDNWCSSVQVPIRINTWALHAQWCSPLSWLVTYPMWDNSGDPVNSNTQICTICTYIYVYL